ncbi:MAG: hypothetical protein A2236_02930 [Bacteroidetes bacterium RIFOXYA2_FULL_33_7]|nr:MAG: hypothetical protein A2236_02930 [Bacteroidetes bacterium RIFOXYA2_FULL_33_7]
MKTKRFNLLIAVILFLIPTLNYAQAPDMGTSADYALFTSVGAVTNSGTGFLTKITGNVGTNSGIVSGFGNVNGVMT